jgi:membrane protein YqaA with SNARE-associated domain
MTARRTVGLAALTAATLAAAYVGWFQAPEFRGLVKLCAYTVVSNVYISLLPHEPVLFYYGKVVGPFAAMLAATTGALLSGVIDHETLTRLLNVHRVRRLYADRRIYKVCVRWYARRPFWTIVVAALTPVPFYPVKFLALSDSYPRGRYLLALVVGRAPRYYIYSWLGAEFAIPNGVIVGAFAAMMIPPLVGAIRGRRGGPDAETAGADGKPLEHVSSD